MVSIFPLMLNWIINSKINNGDTYHIMLNITVSKPVVDNKVREYAGNNDYIPTTVIVIPLCLD
jgi:hypothetical protein